MSKSYVIRPQESLAFVGIRKTVRTMDIGSALAAMLPETAKWLAQSKVTPASPCVSVYLGFDGRTMSFDMLGGFFIRPQSVRALFGKDTETCLAKFGEKCSPDGLTDDGAHETTSGPNCAAGSFVHGLIPEGEVVSHLHTGPYDKLGEAHMSVDAWIKSQGRETLWPCWEIYLTDPGQVPNPADWKTEVVWPIR